MRRLQRRWESQSGEGRKVRVILYFFLRLYYTSVLAVPMRGCWGDTRRGRPFPELGAGIDSANSVTPINVAITSGWMVDCLGAIVSVPAVKKRGGTCGEVLQSAWWSFWPSRVQSKSLSRSSTQFLVTHRWWIEAHFSEVKSR